MQRKVRKDLLPDPAAPARFPGLPERMNLEAFLTAGFAVLDPLQGAFPFRLLGFGFDGETVGNRYGIALFIDADFGEVGPVDGVAKTGCPFLPVNIYPDFHGGPPYMGQVSLNGDEIADMSPLQKEEIIDGCGGDDAAGMAGSHNAGDFVHPGEKAAAE